MKLQYRLVKKLKNKLKVCPKSMYISQKVSEVTIPITNKYGKLKVKIKTPICRNQKYFNLKDVSIINSDILKHYL